MRRIGLWISTLLCFVTFADTAFGQSFGVELHNTLMPASGGMGGVSIARPQDLTSAINGNPATLTQFRGTQFIFGGGWAEPTFDLTQTSNIPVVPIGGLDPYVEPYSAKSVAPGTPVGNIGLTQDLSELGLPATLGLGFLTTAGGFVDFRQVPESHGTNTGQTIFNMPVALGVDVTDRLSVGASLGLGIALFDGPFVGVGGMTPDYALRGTVGANYLLTDVTTVGVYYQTEQSYNFDNAFLLDPPGLGQTTTDVRMDLPQDIGFGVANTALMDGRLLVGVDVLCKFWDEAALYEALYDNQWVVQVGTQYTRGRYRLRAGYVWAENPIGAPPSLNVGGVVQPDLAAVRYTQGLLAITSQHRISFGVGVVDVLPGIDLDLMAGGMFRDTEQLGNFTTTSIASYWIGTGITWRFGRGSCKRLPVPDSWSAGS
jgi:long-chain fatty acid transport protein